MTIGMLAIRVVGIASVVLGVLLMHGLTTPTHDMLPTAASTEAVLGVDQGAASGAALDPVHAGAACLWVLTGGIAAAAIRRALRNVALPTADRPFSTPTLPRATWPGPAPPGSWSYLELASLRR